MFFVLLRVGVLENWIADPSPDPDVDPNPDAVPTPVKVSELDPTLEKNNPDPTSKSFTLDSTT